MHHFTAIFNNRAIGMAFKRPERHIFSFLTIQYVGIKYFLVIFFGPWADILTFHSVCNRPLYSVPKLMNHGVHGERKKGGNFNAENFFNWVASFLYWLCFRVQHSIENSSPRLNDFHISLAVQKYKVVSLSSKTILMTCKIVSNSHFFVKLRMTGIVRTMS